MRRILLLVILFLSTSIAQAGKCSTLRVRHYFDGINDHRGQLHYFTINNGSIVAISDSAPTTNTSCNLIPLEELTITPGLIDSHTHVLLTDHSYGVDFSSELKRQLAKKPNERITEAKASLQSLLKSGFTSIRDLGNSGQFGDLKLRSELMHRNEDTPRIFGSGPGIATLTAQFLPGTAAAAVSSEYRILKDTRKLKSTIQEYKRRGADLIKVYADNDPNPALMPQKLLDSIVNEAHAVGLRVAAHATNEKSAESAATAGVDSIEHGFEFSETALKIMAEKKIFLVATDFDDAVCKLISQHDPNPMYHPCSHYRENRSKRLLAARNKGISIAFGSDMYLALDPPLAERGPATIEALIAYVEEGFSPQEALLAATSSAARLLGHDELGLLKVGAKADFVGFEADPLQNFAAIRNAAFVMKNGTVIYFRNHAN